LPGAIFFSQPDLARMGVRLKQYARPAMGSGCPSVGNSMSNLNSHKKVGFAGARAARPPASRPWPNGLASLRYAPSMGNTGRTSRPRSGIPSPGRHPCAPPSHTLGACKKKIAPYLIAASVFVT
jgi:hypothetical protein